MFNEIETNQKIIKYDPATFYNESTISLLLNK